MKKNPGRGRREEFSLLHTGGGPMRWTNVSMGARSVMYMK